MFVALVFNESPTPSISTLSLHDALPIFRSDLTSSLLVMDSDRRCLLCLSFRALPGFHAVRGSQGVRETTSTGPTYFRDRKSTRLNSSHTVISYAVFCLKKKKQDHDADEI